ncbi:hypothetical protein Tco_1213180 [Tanacetum coccineum]
MLQVRLNKMIHRLVMALPATFHPLNLRWACLKSGKEKAGSENAQLYLDVFEKCTQFCAGNLQQHLSLIFEDSIPLHRNTVRGKTLKQRSRGKERRKGEKEGNEKENPQPLGNYNAAMSSPFIDNHDPNQTGPSISNRSKKKFRRLWDCQAILWKPFEYI